MAVERSQTAEASTETALPVTGTVNNAVLWKRAPVLVSRTFQPLPYSGRVVVEVWDAFSQMMEDCGELMLATVALKLKLGTYTAVNQPLVPVNDTPIADPSRTAGFLGRLVIEAWPDRIFVWLSGDSVVWQRALADIDSRLVPAPALGAL